MRNIDWRFLSRLAIMGTIVFVVFHFFLQEHYSSLIVVGVTLAAGLLARALVPDRPRLKH